MAQGCRVVGDSALLRSFGAGRTSPEMVGTFAAAGRRRRLQVLELLRREHEDDGGVDGAISALLGAWLGALAEGSHLATEVLDDPFVGIWSEGVVRGERELAELGAIERLLSPGLPGDEPFEVEVDLAERDGRLYLPRCGGTLTLTGGTATIRARRGSLSVTGSDGGARFGDSAGTEGENVEWTPVHRIISTVDGCELAVVLSNDDPAAGAVGPSVTLTLTTEDRRRWGTMLDRAWELIVRRHPEHVAGVQVAAAVIVPQHSPDLNRHVSSSSADGLGVIGISFTEDVPTLALGIVHETRHSLLSAAMTGVELHHPDETPRFYAGWRADARPVGALLQGACAFSAVTAFWRVEQAAAASGPVRRRFSLELEHWYRQTLVALDQLESSGLMTPAGDAFIAGMRELTGEATEVDSMVARAVDDLIAEHRLMWRRRCRGWIDPEVQTLTTLGSAWNQRFFSDRDSGGVDPLDQALTGPDCADAADRCCRSLAQGDPDRQTADAFRFARAMEHLGFGRAAAVLLEWVASTEHPNARRLIKGSLAVSAARGEWPSVADELMESLDHGEADAPLASVAGDAR